MKLTRSILGIAAGAMLTTGFALQTQAQDMPLHAPALPRKAVPTRRG